MLQHVERLRAKAPHVRRNIAYGFSAGLTALVAVGWFGALAATGAFSFALTPPAQGGEQGTQAPDIKQAAASARSGFNELLSAAGVASSTTSAAPALNIVETASSSTFDNTQTVSQDQTVIPF